MELYFYTPEQRRMDNGKIVTNALLNMGGKCTAKTLLKQISYCIGQPEEFVGPELKEVLRRGIQSGFLIKQGNSYLLSAPAHSYEIDSGRKRARSITPDRSRSRSPSPRHSAPFPKRVKGTPYKKTSKGATASAARLAAINKREQEETEEEHQKARTSYRQPRSSPKRRKLKFATSPESGKRTSPLRSPQRARGSPSKSSPSKFKKLSLNDDDDDDL